MAAVTGGRTVFRGTAVTPEGLAPQQVTVRDGADHRRRLRDRGSRAAGRRRARPACRRRGAAAGPRRHPRARQRAGPHRVGGLRDRDPRPRRPAASPPSSTCRSTAPADDDAAALEASGRAAEGRPRRRRLLGRRGAGQPGRPALPCTRPGSSASSASCSTPAWRSSRRSTPASWRRRCAELAAFDGLLIVHAEDPERSRPRRGPARRCDYRDFLARARRTAEDAAIDDGASTRPGETGARVHIVHLSSAEALPRAGARPGDGVRDHASRPARTT